MTPSAHVRAGGGYRAIHIAVIAVIGAAALLARTGFVHASAEGLRIGGIVLPETCAYRVLLGSTCPGCGTLRATVFALQGRWMEAWAMHPAGAMLAGYLYAQIVGRIGLLRREKASRTAYCTDAIVSAIGLGAVLLAGLALRMARPIGG